MPSFRLFALLILSAFLSQSPAFAEDAPPPSEPVEAMPSEPADVVDTPVSEEEAPTLEAEAEAQTTTSSQMMAAAAEEEGEAFNPIPAVVAPEDVRSDGSFRYAIPLRIPEFRGLAPNLAITYGSSNTGRGSPSAFLGAGWSLNGFSEIERVSIGGGYPAFDDTLDIFRLDGDDLLACADQNASAPYTGTYPASHLTKRASASCLAGGNLAPQRENYLKIVVSPVTLPNGAEVDQF